MTCQSFSSFGELLLSCCVVLCCVVLKGKLTTCEKEWGSYAFSCVTPITVWVVSKKESDYLSENKMVSTLNWRHVSLLYIVQSNILWLPILLSYHYRCNVVFTNYRFPVTFLLYIATQKNLIKSLLWSNSSTNTPITKKITPARFACLCFRLGILLKLNKFHLLTRQLKLLALGNWTWVFSCPKNMIAPWAINFLSILCFKIISFSSLESGLRFD